MLTIKSIINDEFLNGIYCEKYDVIIHKWTGYINASELCILKGINYLEWIKSPIYLSTCEYIRENLDLKPSHFMPHGIGATQGIYIHPLLLPYLILETGNTDFLRPMNKQNLAELGKNFKKSVTVFKKILKELEHILKDLFKEISNDSNIRRDFDMFSEIKCKPTNKKYLDLYDDYDISTIGDFEFGDDALLRQKIKRQIDRLNKKK